MDQVIIEKAKELAGLFKAGLLPAREAQNGTISGEKGNLVQISNVVLKDRQFGLMGHCLYDTDLQTCLVFEGDDVIVIALYEHEIHYFYCEWDEVIEGHLPIHFLGSYPAYFQENP